jgi:hypothetical protein
VTYQSKGILRVRREILEEKAFLARGYFVTTTGFRRGRSKVIGLHKTRNLGIKIREERFNILSDTGGWNHANSGEGKE